jgi:hypothetical protein
MRTGDREITQVVLQAGQTIWVAIVHPELNPLWFGLNGF